MEDFIAAAVFITALTALFTLTALVLKPYMPTAYVEAPVQPGENTPTRTIYVYAYTAGGAERYYLVEYAGPDVEAFRRFLGVPGVLAAKFEVYPGGYRCELYREKPVKIGDPYTGFWCPPPFDARVDPRCVPVGVTSKGRWLLVQYRCS